MKTRQNKLLIPQGQTKKNINIMERMHTLKWC